MLNGLGLPEFLAARLRNRRQVLAAAKEEFVAAAVLGNLEEVVEWRPCVVIDSKDSHLQITALMGAAASGHVHVVRYLVTCGARIDAQDHRGWTALMMAARNERWDVLLYLLRARADWTRVNALKQSIYDMAPRSRLNAIFEQVETPLTLGIPPWHDVGVSIEAMPDGSYRSVMQRLGSPEDVDADIQAGEVSAPVVVAAAAAAAAAAKAAAEVSARAAGVADTPLDTPPAAAGATTALPAEPATVDPSLPETSASSPATPAAPLASALNRTHYPLAKATLSWTMDDVMLWLASIGREDCQPAFRSHRITGDVLLVLLKSDLVHLGVSPEDDAHIVLCRALDYIRLGHPAGLQAQVRRG